MSALPSQLMLTEISPAAGALVDMESPENPPRRPRTILLAIGEQVGALFRVQRSLAGEFGHAAYAVEDDYRRFANRSS
jgi:hypothetical protein